MSPRIAPASNLETIPEEHSRSVSPNTETEKPRYQYHAYPLLWDFIEMPLETPSKDSIKDGSRTFTSIPLSHQTLKARNIATTKLDVLSETPEELVVIDPETDRKLVRKIDFNLIPLLITLYMLSTLDKAGIAISKLVGIETDLHLEGNQFNWALSVFNLGYILFMLPSNLVLTKLTPRKWIPLIMVVWGCIEIGTTFCKNFFQLVFARFFLGIAEAGLFPGIIFVLSLWYKRSEQNLRFALFAAASALAGAFGGFLSYIITRFNGFYGLSAWQWIFILEGVPTLIFAAIAFVRITNRVEDAKFLKEDEKQLVLDRLREDSVGTTSTQQKSGLQWGQVKDAVFDWKVWCIMLLDFSIVVPLGSMSLFLPTIIKGMGFDTFSTQLLTTPPYVLAAISTLSMAYFSDKLQRRGTFVIAGACIGLAGFAGLLLFEGTILLYISTCVVAIGIFPVHPCKTSWLTNNITGYTKRAVATALMAGAGNVGGFLGALIYRPQDAPFYTFGHTINAICIAIVIVLSFTLRYFLQRENQQRDRNLVENWAKVTHLSPDELADLGDKVGGDIAQLSVFFSILSKTN
ncbi:uncharacterized protein VTP21DRAFT_9185 [Calcarisporiella thermophila]|uniref:uncharacterized protein n=1 Tax=Calcarisporiella thermophila TaxID=911321 RepID=UPI003742736A